jgi:hypothetical protein
MKIQEVLGWVQVIVNKIYKVIELTYILKEKI